MEILDLDHDVILLSEVWILKIEFKMDGNNQCYNNQTFNRNDGTYVHYVETKSLFQII